MIPGSDLCKNCEAVTAQSAGRLLEAPRSHATFDSGLHYLSMKCLVFWKVSDFTVADQFKKAWDNGTQCPNVLEVYKILEPAKAMADFMSYR